MHADESADVHQLDERDDPLAAPRSKKAGRGQGSLAWAVRFYPLWTLSTSPTQQAAIDSATADDGHVKDLATPEKSNIEKGASRNFLQPLFHPPPVLREASGGWLATLARLAEEWVPSRFEWEQERLQRREENVRWLAGKRGIEVAETKVKLSTKRRCMSARHFVLGSGYFALTSTPFPSARTPQPASCSGTSFSARTSRSGPPLAASRRAPAARPAACPRSST